MDELFDSAGVEVWVKRQASLTTRVRARQSPTIVSRTPAADRHGRSVQRHARPPAPGPAEQAFDAALADLEALGQLPGGPPSAVAAHDRLEIIGG